MTKRNILSFLAILFLLSGMANSHARAANCLNIRKDAKQERNLLKKHKILQKAVKECADDPIINYQYAYALERLRKYEEALKYYIVASELDNKNPKYFFGMADIYMILGNAGSAIRAYEKGLQIDPTNKRAQKDLKLVRIKHKAQMGDAITSTEFVQVMKESRPRHLTPNSIEGPILRMQIPFAIDSHALSQAAKKLVDIVGYALQDEELKDAHFEVVGHTDDLGDAEYNMTLSKWRAETVRDYLIANFSIPPDQLSIAYFGENRPIMPNTTWQNQAVNRRVEFKRLKR